MGSETVITITQGRQPGSWENKNKSMPWLESTDNWGMARRATPSSRRRPEQTTSRLKSTDNKGVVGKILTLLATALMVRANMSDIFNPESKEVFVPQE
jgi:hypothetical protein